MPMRTVVRALLPVLVACLCWGLLPVAAAAGGSVTIIDDGAGITGPQATAIAGDGSRVAGSDLFLSGWEYGDGTGLVPLPGLPGDGRSIVEDMSGDGGAIVGQALNGVGWEAFRHTSGGTQALGTLSPDTQSVAYAVSADGAFVVGRSNGVAFGWTQAGGIAPLSGALGSGAIPYGMSGDGGVVAGVVFGVGLSGAFRWTPAGGMVDLGTLPGDEQSSAGPVSADGSTIAGSSYDADTDTSNAFRWTAGGGMLSIGRCAGAPYANPHDISGDGSVIIGDCTDGSSPLVVSFVWTAASGLQTFQDYLAAHGIDGSAITIPMLTAVSDDGRVFSGYDDDVSDINAFVVRVDGPVQVPIAAAPWYALLAAGLLVVGRRVIGSRG